MEGNTRGWRLVPDKKNDPGRGDAQAYLRRLIGQNRGRMAVLAAVSLVGALLEAVFLVLITGIGMSLLAGRNEVGPFLGITLSLSQTLAAAAVLLLGRLGLNLATVHVSASLARKVTVDQRRELAHAYAQTSWAVQQAEPSGILQALMVNFVGGSIAAISAVTTAVTAALSLVAFLGIGVAVDPISTVAVLGALLLLGGLLAPVRRRVRLRAKASAGRGLQFANGVAELGALGLEMQVFGVRSRFADRLDDLTAEEVEASYRVRTLSGALSPLYIFLAYSAILAGVSAMVVWGGTGTNLSVIGAIMLLMLRSLTYGQQLQSAAGSIASSLPYLERVQSTLHRYRKAATWMGRAVPDGVTPLELRSVGFAYTDERPALSDVTITVHSGEIVGVIGPSGAGKSTLAQLLLGVRQPTQGTIRVSGVDLSAVDHTWWTRRVAFVAQDALLFTGTVAENIRFFRDGISDEDVRNAARRANVLRDIERLPQGFDTHLGERGSQLSGGQRQRMSIARALAGRPDLLILDEPTSALDGTSEALIRDTLAALKGEVTVVIIAHRMSTLDICDRIAVVESGRMTDVGSPEELRQTSDYYRNALAVAGIN